MWIFAYLDISLFCQFNLLGLAKCLGEFPGQICLAIGKATADKMTPKLN